MVPTSRNEIVSLSSESEYQLTNSSPRKPVIPILSGPNPTPNEPGVGFLGFELAICHERFSKWARKSALQIVFD